MFYCKVQIKNIFKYLTFQILRDHQRTLEKPNTAQVASHPTCTGTKLLLFVLIDNILYDTAEELTSNLEMTFPSSIGNKVKKVRYGKGFN